jgi:tRNA threonylcarbamoyl adenosine modification protein YeaZ
MKTLVLDTSTNLLFISFIFDDKVVYEVKSVGLNNHSDYLLDLIQKGLNETNIQVKDFDKIIIGVGPGAYTGLRVSMSVAKMFSWTLNIPLYEISSLDLLTSGYREDGLYLIKFKAKKGYIYHKAFEINDNAKKIITEEIFVSDEFIDTYEKDNFKNVFIVSNDLYNIDVLNIKEENIKLVDNVHALEPNYLRDC